MSSSKTKHNIQIKISIIKCITQTSIEFRKRCFSMLNHFIIRNVIVCHRNDLPCRSRFISFIPNIFISLFYHIDTLLRIHSYITCQVISIKGFSFFTNAGWFFFSFSLLCCIQRKNFILISTDIKISFPSKIPIFNIYRRNIKFKSPIL